MSYLDKTGLGYVLGKLMLMFAPISHSHSDYAAKTEAIKSITRSGTTFTATRTDGTTFTFDQQDNNSTYPDAVKSITRSGTTFTATRYSGGTFTFTQQDNNTTYSAGTGITLSGTTFSNKYAKTTLYNNSTGTNGTVTLSASAANYNHMRIHFRQNDTNVYARSSIDLYSPNGLKPCIGMVFTTGANIWPTSRIASISGTSISTYSDYYGYAAANGNNSFNKTNNIYIYRVEAWNE